MKRLVISNIEKPIPHIKRYRFFEFSRHFEIITGNYLLSRMANEGHVTDLLRLKEKPRPFIDAVSNYKFRLVFFLAGSL